MVTLSFLQTGSSNDARYQSVRYHSIGQSPTSERFAKHEQELQPDARRKLSRRWITGGVLVVIAIILISSKYVLACDRTSSASSDSVVPSVRREWRSLATQEKDDYIAAVQCLRNKPSKIGQDQSLYDDFPWVHSHVGEYSHESAAFLAWHRWFIYTYERTLKDECNFQGELPYWDWTLDWQDITSAPVWDDSHGFGCSGDPDSNDVLLNGTCVTTGPFAHLQVLYLKNNEAKHCLSRGFLNPESSEMKEIRDWIRPSTMWDILVEPNYEEFNLRLEESSHIAIPRMIQGDFLLLTAPYDPVFFLHHAQLDRIWFHWQKLMEGRKWQYQGLAAHNVTERASLDDVIPMGGLAADIKVSEIIDTQADTLGYVYL